MLGQMGTTRDPKGELMNAAAMPVTRVQRALSTAFADPMPVFDVFDVFQVVEVFAVFEV